MGKTSWTYFLGAKFLYELVCPSLCLSTTKITVRELPFWYIQYFYAKFIHICCVFSQ